MYLSIEPSALLLRRPVYMVSTGTMPLIRGSSAVTFSAAMSLLRIEDGVDLHRLRLVPLGPAHLALRKDVGVAGRLLGRAGDVGAVDAVVAAAQVEDAAAVKRVVEHVVDRRVQRLVDTLTASCTSRGTAIPMQAAATPVAA